MKKRILKISALCLAIVLIIGVCWFANGLVGNPISKMMARNAAEKYLETNYPNTDYELQEVSYSFKDVGYYAHVVSPSSMDGNFTLRISMLGKIRGDDYSSRVEGHGNVANRLFFEYRDMVDTILNSYAYPYTVSMGYGDLEFERELGKETVEGALNTLFQIRKSSSSVYANIREANYGQSKADMLSKFEIALKECSETEGWLQLLFNTNGVDEETYKNYRNLCGRIRRMLIASCKTLNENIK